MAQEREVCVCVCVKGTEGIYLKNDTRRWQDNIKVHIKEKSCEDPRWKKLADEYIQRHDFVITTLNLQDLHPQL
jgi:hypothetical protein